MEGSWQRILCWAFARFCWIAGGFLAVDFAVDFLWISDFVMLFRQRGFFFHPKIGCGNSCSRCSVDTKKKSTKNSPRNSPKIHHEIHQKFTPKFTRNSPRNPPPKIYQKNHEEIHQHLIKKCTKHLHSKPEKTLRIAASIQDEVDWKFTTNPNRDTTLRKPIPFKHNSKMHQL